jgi:hypothetical protein
MMIRPRTYFWLAKRGAVSLIFAISIIPIMMLVGLALDFGFYNEAQAQLNMAADAAAMHAARVAALLQQQNDPNYLSKGTSAGTSWFALQEGLLGQMLGKVATPQINLQYDQQSNQITAQVSYSGYVVPHFASLFPTNWPGYPYWGITGITKAVISIPTYNEVQMLLDNSSSMLIASTQTDIFNMEAITPCSQQAGNTNDTQWIDTSYSWVYNSTGNGGQFGTPYSAYSSTLPPDPGTDSNGRPVYIPYGYGVFYYTDKQGKLQEVADKVPPQGPSVAPITQCDPRFTGPSIECQYPPNVLVQPSTRTSILNANGQCTANGVVSGGGSQSVMTAPGTTAPQTPLKPSLTLTNMPQAPCAFACHDDLTANGTNDFYALAIANHIQLRYQVLQSAAANVITSMQNSPANSSLSVSVYQFNAPGTADSQAQGIVQVYPAANDGSWYSSTESGQDWTSATSLTADVLPPRSRNVPDTDFENAMTLLAQQVKPAGSGTLPSAPRKNLFIVTDGMDDYFAASDPKNPNNVHVNQNGRVQWAIDPDVCNKFKDSVADNGLGYTVYVLYIQYLPLPNPYYLNTTASLAEPQAGSPIYNALQSCASVSSATGQPLFYVADGSATSINTALQSMLAAAIGTAGRFSE